MADNKEKQNLVYMIDKLKKENTQLSEKNQNLLNKNHLLPEIELMRKKSEFMESSNPSIFEKKRMPRVNKHEVEIIGRNLRYQLMVNNIPHNEIEKVGLIIKSDN